MSIIIKGMKMPDSCLKCQIKSEGSDALYTWGCPFTGFEYTTKEGYKRQDECPLVEIPEKHGDLVDRDYLFAEYDRQHEGPAGRARRIMEAAPTVIEEEPDCTCNDDYCEIKW
ncbi:MAG: hypothetical protein IJI25_08845 [Eubacterium sp.]|nr:hypothetical protein [Eubacterium sp.]